MNRCGRACAWLTFLLLAACARDERSIVAEVRGLQIEAESLRRLVEKLLPGQRPTATGDEARHHYLQILVDGRLMVLEAVAIGLEEDEKVREKIRTAVDQRLITVYQKEQIAPGAPVTEEEARAHFQREGFARERLCSGILAPDRAVLDSVLAELGAGRAFEEVASGHSADVHSAGQGGEIGFVGMTTINKLHIPPDLFRNLPAGEVSDAVPAGHGAWHVFRFTEERAATFAKYRPYIEGLLREERRLLAERQHLERLRAAYGIELLSDGVEEIISAYRRRSLEAVALSATALYRHDQGEISVSEADAVLRKLNLRRAFTDSAEAAHALNGTVLRPYLMLRAAREAELDQRPEILELHTRTRKTALADRLRERELVKIEISEEDARGYYEEHPAMFRLEPSSTVEEILLPTLAEAEEVRKQLDAGSAFAEQLPLSRRPDAERTAGVYHFHPQDRNVYPRLVEAVEAAAGEWTGPVEVEHGYSVFRVIARQPEQVQPFEQVGRRAGQLLRREREAEATRELIERLRDKFREQVVVHEDALRKALPDTLLHAADG